MGIIIWLIVGGIVGWLASLIMRTDAQQGIILNIVVGIVGAVIAGLLLGGGNINNSNPLDVDQHPVVAAGCGHPARSRQSHPQGDGALSVSLLPNCNGRAAPLRGRLHVRY